MRVKVCGITRPEDARACYHLGVHAIGFNFFPGSPRYLAPAVAKEIVASLPPFLSCVGVFVNEPDPCQVEETARSVGLHAIQLHGDETPEYCRQIGSLPVVKAFRTGIDFSEEEPAAYSVQAILLDGFQKGCFGGTGQHCDWQTAAALAKRFPVILSGGLTSANVQDAIRQVKPWAVDVCSGVETRPGIKNAEMIQRFMQQILQGDAHPFPERESYE